MLDYILNLDIENQFGISLDMVFLGTLLLMLILILIMIINSIKTSKMKRAYKKFMKGREGVSLERMFKKRLDQLDEIVESNRKTCSEIKMTADYMDSSFSKMGLVKYDAFQESAGKLSFSLCLLNSRNDGFIINAMHSSEGCYTYIKEVINGNSIILLSEEEKEALDIALNSFVNSKY